MLTREQLIEKYCPTFYFDKNEEYLPITFEEFLNNSTVHYGDLNHAKHTILYNIGEATWDNIIEHKVLNKKTLFNKNFKINVGPEDCKGNKKNIGPIYALTKTNKQISQITYFFICSFNSGSHMTDTNDSKFSIGFISVFVNNKTQKAQKIFYSLCGTNKGIWKKYSKPIKVFVSKGNHSCYPCNGLWRREKAVEKVKGTIKLDKSKLLICSGNEYVFKFRGHFVLNGEFKFEQLPFMNRLIEESENYVKKVNRKKLLCF